METHLFQSFLWTLELSNGSSFLKSFFTSSERQDQRLFSRQTPCPRPATTASFNTHSPAGEQSTHSRDIFFTLKADVVLNEFLASKNGWGGSVFFFFCHWLNVKSDVVVMKMYTMDQQTQAEESKQLATDLWKHSLCWKFIPSVSCSS